MPGIHWQWQVTITGTKMLKSLHDEHSIFLQADLWVVIRKLLAEQREVMELEQEVLDDLNGQWNQTNIDGWFHLANEAQSLGFNWPPPSESIFTLQTHLPVESSDSDCWVRSPLTWMDLPPAACGYSQWRNGEGSLTRPRHNFFREKSSSYIWAHMINIYN